ncbi:MAG: sodium:solute symporter, partial [Cyclobacteriaceae bacterium]|nr:sodium:solute symporter [Cyclobacteriaceae bacterium HetDA_MAG_MS6]
IASLLMPVLFPNLSALNAFPLVLLVSVFGCVMGTYQAPPVDDETLMSFYRNIRPWGFWKPILLKCQQKDPDLLPNGNFSRDTSNIIVGTFGQIILMALPVYMIIQKWSYVLGCILLLIPVFVLLKRYWYDRLENEAEIP